MSDTRFGWWLMWKDDQGRTWVHDPREIGVSDSPVDARRQHRRACEFGWVKDGMFDASVSELLVQTAFGKQAVVEESVRMEDVVKSGALSSPVSARDDRLVP